jgi:TcpE family
VDLPTYTNIWRIEKRLYKLYDFRLPMPLPVGQIAVFAAIAVPYVVILAFLDVPFSHTLLWLYVLPPGVLAWFATRPVLEGKRLPELVASQVRYLSEPRTWCRMAPLAEQEDVLVTARVWRRHRRPVDVAQLDDPFAWQDADYDRPASQAAIARPAAAPRPPRRRRKPGRQPALPPAARLREAQAAARPAESAGQPAARVPLRPDTPGAPAPRQTRPIVTVNEDRSAERPLRMVERALSSPAERRAEGWRDRVVIVPGGHRAGQPDHLQRDRARARLAVSGSRRIVVLGCTVGAGQTVTTLRTGEMLASLRDEPVAVLDLNPGKNSLLERARQDPALNGEHLGTGPAAAPAPSRLEVITTQGAEPSGSQPALDGPGGAPDSGRIFELMSARYALTLADPAAAAVPRVLPVADQLVLVAPASADAAGAIAMTMEWLEAHGHGGLAGAAITVLNGVSKQTMSFVEQAEAVAAGRCRAIVRVPWDDQLKYQAVKRQPGGTPASPEHRAAGGQSGGPAERAYTALAGVLVAGLVTAPELRKAELRKAGS